MTTIAPTNWPACTIRDMTDATPVRSKLYFQLLKRFQEENIPFLGAGGPANVIVDPGPEMQALVRATTLVSGAPPSEPRP